MQKTFTGGAGISRERGIVSGRLRTAASLLAIGGFLFCAAAGARQGEGAATDRVTIDVQADRDDGKMPPISNFWGYDEPNYTYAANGKKLLREGAGVEP